MSEKERMYDVAAKDRTMNIEQTSPIYRPEDALPKRRIGGRACEKIGR